MEWLEPCKHFTGWHACRSEAQLSTALLGLSARKTFLYLGFIWHLLFQNSCKYFALRFLFILALADFLSYILRPTFRPRILTGGNKQICHSSTPNPKLPLQRPRQSNKPLRSPMVKVSKSTIQAAISKTNRNRKPKTPPNQIFKIHTST
jgi:hypothetical protein